jgi:outer membrane immunogenic protein
MRTRIVIAACLASLISSGALAADIPVAPPVYRPAPAVVPPPVFTWTGPYIGVNLGYGWARVSADIVFTGGLLTGVTDSASTDLKGGLAGAQLGFNWQAGMAVFGFEVDAQVSGQERTATLVCGVACSVTETSKIRAFATARARVGLAFDILMVYATGGGAWASASDELSATVGGVSATLLSISGSNFGWTAGGGLEVALGAWSVKLEYLYMAIDNVQGTATVPILLGGGIVTETASIRDNIVRLGLNYRFAPSVVAARY